MSFRRQDPKQAHAELMRWSRRVGDSKSHGLLKYVQILDRRRFSILKFFKHAKTSGLTEALDNVVKFTKKGADGFHDWQYVRRELLRKCGKRAGPWAGRGLKPYVFDRVHTIPRSALFHVCHNPWRDSSQEVDGEQRRPCAC